MSDNSLSSFAFYFGKISSATIALKIIYYSVRIFYAVAGVEIFVGFGMRTDYSTIVSGIIFLVLTIFVQRYKSQLSASLIFTIGLVGLLLLIIQRPEKVADFAYINVILIALSIRSMQAISFLKRQEVAEKGA